jgi:hypothetical protein
MGKVRLKSLQPGAEATAAEFVDTAADASVFGEAALGLAASLRPVWPTVGAATVDITDEMLIVQAHVGIRLVPPFTRLTAAANDQQLGEAIRAAITASASAHGGDSEKDELQFLEAVGVRRDASVSLATSSVRLDTHNAVTIHGLKWTERRGELKSVSTVTLDSPSAEQIGRAVRQALSSAMAAAVTPRQPSGIGVPFGPKSAWLALRMNDPGAVAGALGLHRRRSVSWRVGLEQAEHRGVFISPPVGGWILAFNPRWIGHAPAIHAISERIGAEVQCFETHPVSERHAWSRAIEGRIVREFAYSGETGTCESFGEVSAIELQLEIPQFAAAARDGVVPPMPAPDENTVLRVAGAWSVDPSWLGGADDSPTGIYGLSDGRGN